MAPSLIIPRPFRTSGNGTIQLLMWKLRICPATCWEDSMTDTPLNSFTYIPLLRCVSSVRASTSCSFEHYTTSICRVLYLANQVPQAERPLHLQACPRERTIIGNILQEKFPLRFIRVAARAQTFCSSRPTKADSVAVQINYHSTTFTLHTVYT